MREKQTNTTKKNSKQSIKKAFRLLIVMSILVAAIENFSAIKFLLAAFIEAPYTTPIVAISIALSGIVMILATSFLVNKEHQQKASANADDGEEEEISKPKMVSINRRRAYDYTKDQVM